MRRLVVLSVALIVLTGCTPQQRDPDQIRRETAKATSEAARDTKAAVKGVEQGLRGKSTVNVNSASADDLKALPGIDGRTADRIVAARPYQDSTDLVKRHLITKAEYDRISDRIDAH
jgi:DNA uptake protein ComE-like DNA-binding protein